MHLSETTLSQKLRNILDETVTYYLLRGTDLLGWSSIASRVLRPVLFRLFGLNIGKGVYLRTGLTIHSIRQPFSIGNFTSMSRNITIDAAAPISIGHYCNIGNNVQLINGSHELESGFNQAIRPLAPSLPIAVEDYVWLGAGSIILGGVTVGRGSVVGAGSVVTKDVPPCTVVAGNPAKVIRQLNVESSSNMRELVS